VLHDSRVVSVSSSVSTRSMRPNDVVVDDVGDEADAEFAGLPRMMAFDLSGAPQRVRATFFRGRVVRSREASEWLDMVASDRVPASVWFDALGVIESLSTERAAAAAAAAELARHGTR